MSMVVESLYSAFQRYQRPAKVDFCGFCYEAVEIEYFRDTPLRQMEPDKVRRLLWETGEHWATTDLYKHYLPRILEILTPDIGVEDIYPEHLFEVLNCHLFREWPATEKQSVLRFVAAMEDSLPSASAREEWRQAAATLVRGEEVHDD